jgi:golgi phosphoprotein 3
MELSILKQYVILAIDPDRGRVAVDGVHFRYSLTGALLMDYLEKGEIRAENKILIPELRKNGDPAHDFFINTILNSSQERKVSSWVRRLSGKSRFIFKETVNSLEKERILRIETRKFLNLIPYKKYWFLDKRLRINIIEELREILLYSRKATAKQSMLLGLIKASEAYNILSKEKGDKKLLRKKTSEFLESDSISSEISKAIKETQAAIVTSVVAASVAARGSH